MELPGEEDDMNETNDPDGDLSHDSLELLTEQQMGAFDAMMIEHTGNAEGAASIVRFSAARKYNQEDPIEAACVEMILKQT